MIPAYTFSIREKITLPYVKKSPWLKNLLKFKEPAAIADLIEKRINDPKTIGPMVNDLCSPPEAPTDLIWALIEEQSEEFRFKIESAIGLLLFKILHDEIKQTPDMLRGLFNVIYESKLMGCKTLTYNWLASNMNVMIDASHPLKSSYRDGMLAFAMIQTKNELVEHYWLNIWEKGNKYYQAAAFVGLRVQNPKAATKELQLFSNRDLDNKDTIMSGFWLDENSRHQLEAAIKRGLNSGDGWAGKLLNTLLGALNEEQRGDVLLALKGVNLSDV